MSVAGVQGYESARPTRVCAATGRSFEAGERYVATLAEHGASGELVRLDYSTEAWDAGARPGAGLVLIGTWRARADTPGLSAAPVLSVDESMDLFERLGEATEPRAMTTRYLLALLLMRKRVLLARGTRRDARGRVLLVLAARAGDATYEVVDPGLDERSTGEGIEELGALIGGAKGNATRTGTP